jgi:hypothetical protein
VKKDQSVLEHARARASVCVCVCVCVCVNACVNMQPVGEEECGGDKNRENSLEHSITDWNIV